MIYNTECNTRAKHQEQSQVEQWSTEIPGRIVLKLPEPQLTFPVMEIQGLHPHAAGLNHCSAPPSAACLFPEGFQHLCSSVHTFVKQCSQERQLFTSRLLGFSTTTWTTCGPKSPLDLTNNASFVACVG